MPTSIRRALSIAAATMILFTTTTAAQTQTPAEPALERVRAETPEIRALLGELIARSPTALRLVDRLRQSDVIVYVRSRWFASDAVSGHVGVLPSDAQHHFLIIELACRRTQLQQMVALGHELRHAVEIADAGSVTDVASLSALYRRIGESVSVSGALEAYETNAAVEAARRIRAEIIDGPRLPRAAASKIDDAAATRLR
jgi:hypothetical protein